MNDSKIDFDSSRRFWTVTLGTTALLTVSFFILIALIHVGVLH